MCVFVLWASCLRAKIYYYYMWPFAKKLYHGWISTMTSSNEISWKFLPLRNEELVAPLLIPQSEVKQRTTRQSTTKQQTAALRNKFDMNKERLLKQFRQMCLDNSVATFIATLIFVELSSYDRLEISTLAIKVATLLWKHILCCFQELERYSAPPKYFRRLEHWLLVR